MVYLCIFPYMKTIIIRHTLVRWISQPHRSIQRYGESNGEAQDVFVGISSSIAKAQVPEHLPPFESSTGCPCVWCVLSVAFTLLFKPHFLARVSFHLHLTHVPAEFQRFFKVHPEPCGRWTHFEVRIFFKWVGEKPPTSFSLGLGTGGITLYSFWFSWRYLV